MNASEELNGVVMLIELLEEGDKIRDRTEAAPLRQSVYEVGGPDILIVEDTDCGTTNSGTDLVTGPRDFLVVRYAANPTWPRLARESANSTEPIRAPRSNGSTLRFSTKFSNGTARRDS